MNLHGIFPTEDDLREMIERVDRNSNGTVDYEEFVKMMMDISQVNQQRLRRRQTTGEYQGRC